MTTEVGVRPAPNRPATKDTVARIDENLVRAAARILARHYHPDWRPSSEQLDDWAHGYADGHRQGYADGRSE